MIESTDPWAIERVPQRRGCCRNSRLSSGLPVRRRGSCLRPLGASGCRQ